MRIVNARQRLHILGLSAALLLAACGGGGGGGGNPPAPPPPPAPSGLSYPSPQSLRVNAAMTAIAPTVTGTVATYTVAPALPAGIALNPATGQISGTPTGTAAPATYTVTATNTGGSTTFGLSLKVFGVDVQSGAIARLAAQYTTIYPEVLVHPVHFTIGALYATATDPNGLILPGVTVTDKGNGTWSLLMQSNSSVAPAVFAGNVTLNLCRDAACTQPQDVPSITVPYSINVVSFAPAWPGDNLKALAAWPGAPDWSTLQGNASHTGLVPATTNPDQFTLRWRIPGHQSYNAYTVKPNLVTWNNMFFVITSDYLQNGVVYGKRESDGSEVWHFNVSGMGYPSANPVAVANGVVYFAAGHQNETYMFARNATDGSRVYETPMASQWEDYFSPTIGPNGMLYANGGTYGGVYAFNPAGNQLFFSSQDQVSNWTPAVNATGVYAYTGGALNVLDPLTGAVNVTILDPNHQNYVYQLFGAPVLGNAALGSVFGAAYANARLNNGAIGNSLTNFRTTTASIGWQVHGAYPATPGYRDGVLYAVNNVPTRFEARAEATGDLLWSWTPEWSGESTFESEVVLTDTHAFVSTNFATHVIDLATHKPVWSYPLSGRLALSPNGILYIHNNNDLVAVNLK